MRWQRWTLFAFLFATTLTFASCVSALGTQSYTPQPMPQRMFVPVTVPSALPVASAEPVPTPEPTVRHSSAPTLSPRPTATRGTSHKAVVHGEASWGYGFYGHVVTRYHRGTIIRVCGPIGCTGKVASWGYGPARYTGRIADLDVRVFERVCGPRSIGVCDITLEVWK